MKKKINILHILSSNHFSGAENVVCQIINIFKEDNIEMVYCSPNGQIEQALNKRDIKYFPLNKLSVKEVKLAIKQLKPNIIHAHDVRASVIASWVSKDIPVISHIHGNHENMRKIRLKSLLYKVVSRKFNKIIWVSNSSYHNYYYRDYVNRKSMVLYNILDVDNLNKKVEEDKNLYNYDIVYVGRLTYPKNPKRLIDVLNLVIKKDPNIKVAIIGDGDLLEKTKEYTLNKGINKNIDFLGFMENPLKVIYDSKVMIMTSIYEGTPMSALESMALGVPIVSTPTDGLVELINHGNTGFLSEDNRELSEYIITILKNDDMRMNMSHLSKIRALELNDVVKYKNNLLEVYREQKRINRIN